MSNIRKGYLTIAAALFVTLAVAGGAIAKTHDSSAFPNIKIKNFGQMDDRFYRGAQPGEKDFKDLADLGVKTVIDLRDNPTSYEKRDVEALGMRYVNIPMSDSAYPKMDEINEFLKVVDDPATGKFFVHCAGGRHRTGVMGAVYRYTHNHWSFDQVYAEMKSYDFYTTWGHGALKQFVQDYGSQIQASSKAASQTLATSTNK